MNIPGMYGVLPPDVRYDKQLKPVEILLYAELTALSGRGSYCIVDMEYLTGLYEITEQTVRSYLSNLEKRNHIKTEMLPSGKLKIFLN